MPRRGNETAQRGRGYRSRLTPEEQDALNRIAEQHGYKAVLVDGLKLKPGVVLCLGIISGETATVFLDSDERWHTIMLLEAHEDETLRDIGKQLRRAAERGQSVEDADIEEAIEERHEILQSREPLGS
jgi:hypothetical protein